MFRTDALEEGWSYIGQSTRLDRNRLHRYFGSGDLVRPVFEERGPAGLQKTVLATATNQVELHYLDMLHIARARRDGAQLVNGDFGGPRPFNAIQLPLWNTAPADLRAAADPDRFYQALLKDRDKVEQAIQDAGSIPVDEFYLGMERDLLATQDLSHACSSCGSVAGEVCGTNAKSLTELHRPARNHSKWPRREVRT